jgi:enamine deaminase RidA (YjgF/YER057c/UK114 family)
MVLKQSGYDFSNVVRLNIYATDVRAVLDNWDVVSARLEPAGCRPSSSLIGVAHLALPELMVEIEATAVK